MLTAAAELRQWPADWTTPGFIARGVALAITTAARAITGVRARWICDKSEMRRIYVANHTSHADFVLLWASLPENLRARTLPVAAADYWRHGPVRRFLIERAFQGVLIDRGNRSRNPISPMLGALQRGRSLILFPEGTRGSGHDVLPFKCGLYHLALAYPDVEIVPVYIQNSNRVLPKGAIFPVPLLCSITFGSATRLVEGEDKAASLARIRQCVIKAAG